MSEIEDAGPTEEVTTGEGVTETPPTSTEDVTAEPQPQKEAKGVQKRINELTGNWRQEQRRADQLQEQNHELQRKIVETPAPEAPKAAGEPKLDDFSTYEEYVDARADFRVAEGIKEFRESQARDSAVTQEQQAAQDFHTRAGEFRQTHDDFDEIAFNPTLNITKSMSGLINATDKGPELLYHLGQNPDEATAIARLPQDQAAMALGRMEAQMGALQPNTQTGAPDPIAPLTGGQGSTAKDPEDMSTTEWLAWRQNQLGANDG